MNGQKQWTRVAVMALLVITVMAGEGGKAEKQGKKERKSDCGDWQWSVCVANEGDCGLGTREGTRTGTDCKQTIKTQRCKIPCNWKKKFGGSASMTSRLGGSAIWRREREQSRRAEASAPRCNLRRHCHSHQALWENPQD